MTGLELGCCFVVATTMAYALYANFRIVKITEDAGKGRIEYLEGSLGRAYGEIDRLAGIIKDNQPPPCRFGDRGCPCNDD